MIAGLMYCQHNESLLVKSIKHQERLGNLAESRAILVGRRGEGRGGEGKGGDGKVG